MNMHGYVNGYCKKCNGVMVLSRMEAYAEGIIKGDINYPII